MKEEIIIFDDQLIQKLVDFICYIGIPVFKEESEEDTFLPGILIKNGALYINEKKLKYPGDLLHEAGHLATLEPIRRIEIYNDVSKNAGDELATLAWSYAAAKYLDIDLDILFHDQGYKGDSKWLREHYSQGGDIGIPLLQWMGLTYDKKQSVISDTRPFPVMQKWLRE